MNKVLHKKSLQRIQGIHRLSQRLNRRLKKDHSTRLLELMRSHIEEIEELMKANNRHALVETGDLIVLCFELLLENKASPDEIMLRCFHRYEEKLAGLIDTL